MRFARLYLRAYGRFSGEVVSFARVGDADLHIVFGPNEAGKSTTLHAVTDLLFGFEHRVAHDFRHAPSDLRVGASLELPGAALHVMRRRGRTRTLFTFDPVTLEERTDQPLPEDTLVNHLPGLDRTAYRMLLGLDLAGLEAGGQALLAGAGEVGQSLFQAASGLSTLKRAGDALSSGATALFTARSQRPLNKAIAEHTDLARKVRELALRPSQWEETERHCRKTEQDLAALRRERRQVRGELERLGRIRGNRPHLVQRSGLLAELATLDDAPRLDAAAAERRQAAQERLLGAQRALREVAEELDQLSRQRAALVVDKALLAAADEVDALHRGADAYAQAVEERARQAASADGIRARLRALLHTIAPGTAAADAARLLPSPTEAAWVRRLARERGQLDERRIALSDQIDKARVELARAQVLAGAPPPAPRAASLQLAMDRLADLPQIEQSLQTLSATLDATRAQAARRAVALGAADVDALMRIVVPARADIADVQAGLAACAGEAEELRRRLEELGSELDRRRTELGRLQAGGDVVTRAQLERAREHRDRLWSVVRRLFIEGDPAARAAAEAQGTAQPLPDAFEQTVCGTDLLADHLHADAARAARFSALNAEIEQHDRAVQAVQARQARLDARQSELAQRWRSMCLAVGARAVSPEALSAWIDDRDAVALLHDRAAEQRVGLGALQVRCTALVDDLDALLSVCGLPDRDRTETAAVALQRLRAHHASLIRTQAEREAALSRIRECVEEGDRLHRSMAALDESCRQRETQWHEVLQALRLSPAMGQDEAEVRLAQFEQLGRLVEESLLAERLLTELGDSVIGFERLAADLQRLLGRARGDLPLVPWVRRLQAELGHARAAQARADEIETTLVRLHERERSALQDLHAAGEALDELAREAGCVREELPEVHARSARRLALEAKLQAAEQALIDANGCDIGRIAEESSAYDVDDIGRALGEVQERLVELDDRIDASQRLQAQARQALDALDGGGAAAALCEEQAAVAARIAVQARAWSRARMASAVLHSVVQRYRERRQGPLLARAAEHFAAITCGRFTGLTTDYDEERQVMLGVRPDRSRVGVSGMSQGTRDQLYLALRLATIEGHLSSRGSVPVVVDDLLVQFDDDRAVAALRGLCALAQRTQVLVFTHHEHLTRLALDAGIVSPPQVQRLDALASPV